MTNLEYLYQSLDSLMGIIELSKKEVYETLDYKDQYNYANNPANYYKDEFEAYQDVVCTSAFILGFTYFEDFISKCTKELYIKRPELNKRKFTIKEFLEMDSNYISILAEKQIQCLKISSKLKLLESNFLSSNKSLCNDIEISRVIRNCIIHNNGIADKGLSTLNSIDFSLDKKIILNEQRVNSFGYKVREYSGIIWSEIKLL